MVIEQGLVYDIGVIIIVATILAYIAHLFRQPFIPAYILTGVIIGPLVLGLVKDTADIASLSEIGIAFLLFIVGLEINLPKLKQVSLFAVVGGLLQVGITFAIGYLVGSLLGFSSLVSVYTGLIIAFSSTSVVVKLLKDKEVVDTLHGKLMLGLLIMQDVIVVFVLAALATVTDFSFNVLGWAFLKTIILILIVVIVSRFALPGIFNFSAKSHELLFLWAVTIMFLFALLSSWFGFSIVIGAFMAGVGLASLPYNHDIAGHVEGLRGFFSTIFFVALGLHLVPITSSMVFTIIVLLLVVLIIKPIIIFLLASIFGYEKRTSFITGVDMGQVSEFSLIMAVLAFYTFKHINQEFFSIAIFVTITSMLITSYIINHDSGLYLFFSRFLSPFEKLAVLKNKSTSLGYNKKKKHHVILFGCHRMGSMFLKNLQDIGKNVIVIDSNPDIIKQLMDKKVDCIYGDATNIEVLRQINVSYAKMVISAIPDKEINKILVSYLKDINPQIVVVVTENHVESALDLYSVGADYVLLPHLFTGKHTAILMKKFLNDRNIATKLRKKHVSQLLNSDRFGH
ncbi:MAG: cation:proton antiporter [Nanoarchaeota archaeon]